MGNNRRPVAFPSIEAVMVSGLDRQTWRLNPYPPSVQSISAASGFNSNMPGLNPLRILLLAGLWAGICLHAFAQDEPDFSFAPPLSDALTADVATAPVTTLAIDLLAPQRSFTYDSTGASISANALDPSVRVDLAGAAGETDTAIRDSTQTGQISPYSSDARRLSSLFSGIGPAPGSGRSPAAPGIPEESTTQADTDDGQPYGGRETPVYVTHSSASYQSSWGSSYPSSSAISASSWGGRSSSGSGSGAGSSSEPGAGSALGSGYQSGSSLWSTQRGAVDDPYRSQPSPNIGWRSFGLSRSRPTANGIPSAVSRGPTRFAAGSTDRFTSRPGQVPGQIQDPYAPVDPLFPASPSGGSGSVAEQSYGQSVEGSLSFLPDSGTGSRLDRSPFSSFGEVDFLQPNIFSVSPIPLLSNARTPVRERNRDRTLSENTPLETSKSHYGIKSLEDSQTLPWTSTPRGTGKRNNPYLTGNRVTSNKGTQ